MAVSEIEVAILGPKGILPFPESCSPPFNIRFFDNLPQFLAASCTIYIDSSFEPDPVRVSALEKLLPATVMVNTVAICTSELPAGFFRYNGWPGLSGGNLIEIAGSGIAIPSVLLQFAEAANLSCVEVPDLPGMVRPRVVAMVINEAFHALDEGVSSEEEINTAMKLGTNYPYGPFEWAARIGLGRIHELLLKMALKDNKYQPAKGMSAALEETKWQIS